jgi:hypothetical protein
MDPITIIVSALAAGAAAGLKPTAEKAIKDAYEGLKSIIQRKIGNVSVEALETKPDSKAKQDSVAEDLVAASANQDPEVMAQTKMLLDVLKKHEEKTGKPVGLDWKKIEVKSLELGEVFAVGEGTGVRIENSKLGDVKATKVTAGEPGKKP